MQLKPSTYKNDNVQHRCGTCGSVFQTIQELSAHMALRHLGRPRTDEDGWLTTRQPLSRTAHASWRKAR